MASERHTYDSILAAIETLREADKPITIDNVQALRGGHVTTVAKYMFIMQLEGLISGEITDPNASPSRRKEYADGAYKARGRYWTGEQYARLVELTRHVAGR